MDTAPELLRSGATSTRTTPATSQTDPSCSQRRATLLTEGTRFRSRKGQETRKWAKDKNACDEKCNNSNVKPVNMWGRSEMRPEQNKREPSTSDNMQHSRKSSGEMSNHVERLEKGSKLLPLAAAPLAAAPRRCPPPLPLLQLNCNVFSPAVPRWDAL